MREEHVVPKIGSGTGEDPYRPDLSEVDVPYGAIVQIIEDLGSKVKIEVVF